MRSVFHRSFTFYGRSIKTANDVLPAIYNRFRLVVAFPGPVSGIVLDNLEKSGAMDKHTAIVGLNS